MRLVKGEGSLESRTGCWMSAISYYVGDHWSDHPECVCPVILALAITLNDRLETDAERERVIGPHLFTPVGTAGDRATMERRAFMAADVAVRVFAPMALDAAGLTDDAIKLRNLPRIRDQSTAAAAVAAVYAAADAAADAYAYAAVYAAVYAYAAANTAAYAAARAATRAAETEANADAAYAYDAARAAAHARFAADTDAAADTLLRLILRMCQIGDRREVVPAHSKREVVAFLSD